MEEIVMCTYSKELKSFVEVEVGQKLQVASLETVHGGTTPAFALTTEGFGCKAGVCLKTGWGLKLNMTSRQAEALSLLTGTSQGREVYYTRFVEAKDRKDIANARDGQDVLEVEMGEAVVVINFGAKLIGVQATVAAAPGQAFTKPLSVKSVTAMPRPTPVAVSAVTVAAAQMPSARIRLTRVAVSACVLLLALAQ